MKKIAWLEGGFDLLGSPPLAHAGKTPLFHRRVLQELEKNLEGDVL
jgi:hypothetical protein